MNRLFRDVLLLLWVSGALGTTEPTTTSHGDTTTITSTSSGSSSASITSFISTTNLTGLSSTSGNGTCSSRTVNYITHTLPRQCLRTDRVPSSPTSITGSSDTESRTTSVSYSTTSAADQTAQEASGSTKEPQSQSSTDVPTSAHPEETASTSATPSSTEASESTSVEDADSPLDNAHFLSFEDWKKQNLAKTGQSPEDVGRAPPVNPNRPRPGINNALDTLGEESEIDLDFTGFGGAAKPPLPEGHRSRSSAHSESAVGHYDASSVLRSKDAGKTCKERTNYASFDCSATILKSNKECKSASSVLVENKDSYMLNTCSAQNKFFIVQLCNDIQIDTIVLANYEFFSSSFRHFRVSVSDRYPVEMDKWKDLGTFEARNTREIQAFLVENPIIWAKYLRIEFLSHYGTEYYCPVSLLRVHGTTMIEDYRHQEYIAQGEVEEITLEAEVLATPAVVLDPIETVTATLTSTENAAPQKEKTSSEATVDTVEYSATSGLAGEPSEGVIANNASFIIIEDSGTPVPTETNATVHANESVPSHALPISNATARSNTSSHNATEEQIIASEPDGTKVPSTGKENASHPSAENVGEAAATASMQSSPATNSTQSNTSSITETFTNNSAVSSVDSTSTATTAVIAVNQPTQTANSTRTAASPPPAQPSTQESFFKSFAKRLSQLESNSTLSLQYIEEQSRILRDAFSKVEKRQVSTTTKFLAQLNETVMAELHGFRQAYDQLWQSTVIELDGQRESYQREMLAMSSRLTMVADELVWQKRMGIVQSTLLLLCLALVLFGRGSNGYLEVPLMQQFRRWEYSEPNSPSPDSRSPVSLFRRKLWRSKTDPTGDTANTTDSEMSQAGPDVVVDPPSPPRVNVREEGQEVEEDLDVEVHEENQSQKTQSPKRHRTRKRPKKPPNWPQGNGDVHGRVTSPLAM